MYIEPVIPITRRIFQVSITIWKLEIFQFIICFCPTPILLDNKQEEFIVKILMTFIALDTMTFQSGTYRNIFYVINIDYFIDGVFEISKTMY